jgi:hypothetical protein
VKGGSPLRTGWKRGLREQRFSSLTRGTRRCTGLRSKGGQPAGRGFRRGRWVGRPTCVGFLPPSLSGSVCVSEREPNATTGGESSHLARLHGGIFRHGRHELRSLVHRRRCEQRVHRGGRRRVAAPLPRRGRRRLRAHTHATQHPAQPHSASLSATPSLTPPLSPQQPASLRLSLRNNQPHSASLAATTGVVESVRLFR